MSVLPAIAIPGFVAPQRGFRDPDPAQILDDAFPSCRQSHHPLTPCPLQDSCNPVPDNLKPRSPSDMHGRHYLGLSAWDDIFCQQCSSDDPLWKFAPATLSVFPRPSNQLANLRTLGMPLALLAMASSKTAQVHAKWRGRPNFISTEFNTKCRLVARCA
jgi:hypothetical protein